MNLFRLAVNLVIFFTPVRVRRRSQNRKMLFFALSFDWLYLIELGSICYSRPSSPKSEGKSNFFFPPRVEMSGRFSRIFPDVMEIFRSYVPGVTNYPSTFSSCGVRGNFLRGNLCAND